MYESKTFPTDIFHRYAVWFILQVAVVNSYLLMKKVNPAAKRDTPARSLLQFKMLLAKQLILGIRPKKSNPEQPSLAGASQPLSAHHNKVRIPGRKKRCYQCSKDGRKGSTGRPMETVWGCLFCKIHLHKGHCYSVFHENLV